MRLRVERNVLRMCLTRLARIVSPKTPAPLSCLLLQAEAGSLHLTVMNAALVSRISIHVDVLEPGAALVPIHRLRPAIDAMQDQEITLATNETSLAASLGRRRVTTQGLPPDEYPALPSLGPAAESILVSADALAGVLKFTQHAAGEDPEVSHAFGVRLIQVDGRLTAMATNGQRGAVASVPAEGPDLDVFVIHPALREVTGWMSDRVKITRDDTRIELACSNASVSWRNGTQGTPDLRSFFQSESAFAIETPRLALLQAVDAVCEVAKQNDVSSYRIVLRAMASGELSLCSSSDGSSAVDGLEGRVISGKPDGRPIGLNGSFVADALNASMAGIVRLGFDDPLSPVRLITPDLDAVIMPIRLMEEP